MIFPKPQRVFWSAGVTRNGAVEAACLERVDATRRAAVLLTLAQGGRTVACDNSVLDPFSLLVGTGVRIGRGNVFHPAVALMSDAEGEILIGDGNTLPGVISPKRLQES